MRDPFENHIRQIAQHLPYPPSPSPQRRIQWRVRYVAAALLLMGVLGAAVPDIRASVVSFFRIGAVTVYLDGRDMGGELLQLKQVAGETTLSAAQDSVPFSLRLPPDDFPDRVFVQDDSLVIFVWLAGDDIERALFQTLSNQWSIFKSAESVVQTQVGEQSAFWIRIGHPVQFVNGERQWTYFVEGHVLVWEQNGITYRLETSTPLDEAQRLAESLKEIDDD